MSHFKDGFIDSVPLKKTIVRYPIVSRTTHPLYPTVQSNYMTSFCCSAAANIIDLHTEVRSLNIKKSPSSWNKLSKAGEADESTVRDNVAKHPGQGKTRWANNLD